MTDKFGALIVQQLVTLNNTAREQLVADKAKAAAPAAKSGGGVNLSGTSAALPGSFQQLSQKLGGFAQTAIAATTAQIANTSSIASITQNMVGAAKNLGKLSSGFQTAYSGLWSLTASFFKATAMLYILSKIVENINPGAVDLFMQAIGDLAATIGQGLLPIIVVFTQVINQIAAILNPLFQALAPILQQLAQMLGGVFVAVIKLVADVLQAIAPTLQLAADILQIFMSVIEVLISVISTVLMPIIMMINLVFMALKPVIDILIAGMKALARIMGLVATIVSALVKAIIQSISGMFGNDLTKGITDLMDQFAAVVMEIIVGMTLLVMAFLKFVGFMSTFNNFQKIIQAQLDGDKKKSVKRLDPTIEGIASLVNKLSLAAAAAAFAPGKDADPMRAALEKLVEGMNDMQKNSNNLQMTITRGVRDALNPFNPGNKPVFQAMPQKQVDKIGELAWKQILDANK